MASSLRTPAPYRPNRPGGNSHDAPWTASSAAGRPLGRRPARLLRFGAACATPRDRSHISMTGLGLDRSSNGLLESWNRRHPGPPRVAVHACRTIVTGGMHAMDRYNYDTERVRRCVIQYSTPDEIIARGVGRRADGGGLRRRSATRWTARASAPATGGSTRAPSPRGAAPSSPRPPTGSAGPRALRCASSCGDGRASRVSPAARGSSSNRPTSCRG